MFKRTVVAAVMVAAIASLFVESASAQTSPQSVAEIEKRCEVAKSFAKFSACTAPRLLARVTASDSPATELPKLDREAHASGGRIDASCHILMHEVGRRWGDATELTLAELQSALPKSNDPSCSAGFAHGLLISLGPKILATGPVGAGRECRKSPTRYQSYSCIHGLGHAYMRMFSVNHAGQAAKSLYMPLYLSLSECRKLSDRDYPDCSQGAFHDYWLAQHNADGAKRGESDSQSPRDVCGRQPIMLVRPCWYRAFLEMGDSIVVKTTDDVLRLCKGLKRTQRSGCVTAASVVSSPDPYDQLEGCVRLSRVDQIPCAQGAAIQALSDRPLNAHLELLGICKGFATANESQCVTWVSKILAVVTDGDFGEVGCRAMMEPASSWCKAGVSDIDDALITFS
jgi:hypothetical protein